MSQKPATKLSDEENFSNYLGEFDKFSKECGDTFNPVEGLPPMPDLQDAHNRIKDLCVEHNMPEYLANKSLLSLIPEEKREEVMREYFSYLNDISIKEGYRDMNKIIQNRMSIGSCEDLSSICEKAFNLLKAAFKCDVINGQEYAQYTRDFNFKTLKMRQRFDPHQFVPKQFNDLVDCIEQKKRSIKNKKKKMRKMKNKAKLKQAEDERKKELHEKVQRRKQSRAS